MTKSLFILGLLSVVGPLGSGAAFAQGSAPVAVTGEQPGPVRTLGVGIKVGSGMGFIGGDIVINPVEHLSIDLQANHALVGTNRGTASGVGLVPGIQWHFRAGQQSGPYLGAALIYWKLGVDGDKVSATGMAFNIGWEWKGTSGFGIILGGGVAHIMNVSTTTGLKYNGQTTMPSFEFGVRYMFI